MSQPPALHVAHLSHTYPKADRAALDDIHLDVAPGEIFGILGPNGGGKTTLFRILATLLRPHLGAQTALRIFEHDVLNDPDKVRQSIGVVFQHPSLDIKLTAEENLRYHGQLLGITRKPLQERIAHHLEQFGLTDRRKDYVEKFSGGMRRRVEIAKALLHKPRLLLMDEPASGLDPAARRDVWTHLLELRNNQGVTVAMTTHLMDEADRCDRLAILSQGKVVAVDTPDNLKRTIGGDVVTLTPKPDVAVDDLARELSQAMQEITPQVIDNTVRFEHADGPAIIAQISSVLPGRIARITVGQPTLEDVFLNLTGSNFDHA